MLLLIQMVYEFHAKPRGPPEHARGTVDSRNVCTLRTRKAKPHQAIKGYFLRGPYPLRERPEAL